MKRCLVDTNLIVRHLVQDHPAHTQAAAKLFGASDRGELLLVILPEVIAECVFVLESFYKQSRPDISRVLGMLLSGPGIEVPNLIAHLDGLNRYQKSRIHIVDCIIAATAALQTLPVATFDADFKKFGDLTVEPP